MSGHGAATLTLSGVSATPGRTAVLRDVGLTVAAGTTTTVVGPSGAGKTTLLRVVAGLEPTTAGSVLLDGRDLTTVPAHRRGIGVVFQEPRLLPHRTVAGNVAFGLEAAGAARSTIDEVVGRVLASVGLEGFGDRGVTGLSGGEQQRVNLARALALDPPLLLLDEPLAAVDPERRSELRTLVADVTSMRTTLHVTHDLAEAAELGDELGVLLGGRLVQHDRPRQVLEHPCDVDVARFVGATNIVTGTVRDGSLCIGGPQQQLRDAGCVLPDVGGAEGPACVAVRPEHVVIGSGPLAATVTATSYRGTHSRVRLALGDGQVLHADVSVIEAPRPGDSVTIDLRGAHRLDHVPTTETT